jgi:hypothetical protein
VAALVAYDRYLGPTDQFQVRQYLYDTYLKPAVHPTLTIGRTTVAGAAAVRIAWPQADGTGYVLQSNTALSASGWTDITAFTVEGTECVVKEPLNSPTGLKFYRLKKQ